MIGTIHKPKRNTHNNQSGGGTQTAPAAHTHTIADITGLQEALESKAEKKLLKEYHENNLPLENEYSYMNLRGYFNEKGDPNPKINQGMFNTILYEEIYLRKRIWEPILVENGYRITFQGKSNSNHYTGRIIVCEGNATINILNTMYSETKFGEYRFLKMSLNSGIFFESRDLTFVGENPVVDVPQNSMIHLLINYDKKQAHIIVYPPYIASSGHRATVTPVGGIIPAIPTPSPSPGGSGTISIGTINP
ncbi:MAG: hypothetical protein ACTTJI_03910 [Capnocytophaga sp.]|uniref:hypothetical protein n=1 Tax=Capnocytophaga sp. TaxID=44737 RepID=UPI003F9F8069